MNNSEISTSVSDSVFLAPMQPSHIQRAWERQPRPAASRTSRMQKIWKKQWDLDRTLAMSAETLTASASKPIAERVRGKLDSPTPLRRVVKRRCIVTHKGSPSNPRKDTMLEENFGKNTALLRTAKGTSWERRESGRFSTFAWTII